MLSGGPKQRIGGGDLISGNEATTCKDQMIARQSEYPGTVTGGCDADTIRLDNVRHSALRVGVGGVGRLKVLQVVIATLVCDHGRLMEARSC